MELLSSPNLLMHTLLAAPIITQQPQINDPGKLFLKVARVARFSTIGLRNNNNIYPFSEKFPSSLEDTLSKLKNKRVQLLPHILPILALNVIRKAIPNAEEIIPGIKEIIPVLEEVIPVLEKVIPVLKKVIPVLETMAPHILTTSGLQIPPSLLQRVLPYNPSIAVIGKALPHTLSHRKKHRPSVYWT